MDEAEVIESLDEKVGRAIRDAQAAPGAKKLLPLKEAERLLLAGEAHLIDNFLDEMLEFASVAHSGVRCCVAAFVEAACKKDAEVMKKAVFTLSFLIADSSDVAVIKRVMLACLNLYPIVLRWVVAKKADGETEACWEKFSLIKRRVVYNLESENEGIRTMAIKFLEALVLAQSRRTEESEGRALMNLMDVPRDHRFISYRKLDQEAQLSMESLLKQTALAHISAQNLLTVVSALCNIARQRPEFMKRVVEALDQLQVNLPPTLGTSQVKSVRKELKMHLIRLLKHPSSEPLTTKITSLLSDLGVSQAEISKAVPEARKRPAAKGDEREEPSVKKTKDDRAMPSTNNSTATRVDGEGEEDEDDEDERGGGDDFPSTSSSLSNLEQKAIDITEEYIFERLNNRIAAHLVFISLATLPNEMPPAFASSYTPIATAGTDAQRRRLSRMMATQMTQMDIGPGAETLREGRKQAFLQRRSARSEGAVIPPTPAHVMMADEMKKPAIVQRIPPKVPPATLPPPTQAKKQFSLVLDTKELSAEERERLFELAIKRIMLNERRAVQGGAGQAQQKLLVRLVCRFREECQHYEKLLVDFILQDQKARAELALLWISELYAQFQGFSICIAASREEGRFNAEERLERYGRVVSVLLTSLYERGEHKEMLFHKILLEAPLLTGEALGFLKLACIDEVFGAFGTTTLRELVLTRARQRDNLLELLFHLAFFERVDVRTQAVETVKELLELPYMVPSVCQHVEKQLEECCADAPPAHFIASVNPTLATSNGAVAWNDSLYRAALIVPLAAMAHQHSLIHPLAKVFARSTNAFKLLTIRVIDSAVKAMGMSSPEIPKLVENCPRGAESLVARVVILLTERAPATPELVTKLKKLHEERQTDVRSLLPIIPGLDRSDIIRILPKFVLPASHVKSVVQAVKKMLHAKLSSDSTEPALSAVDLLVEYHRIQPSTPEESEMLFKNIEQVLGVKAMTKEVVSSAVEKMLGGERPLPPLLFHTLAIVYNQIPALSSFLSNVLQKMISRHLWQDSAEQKAVFYKAVTEMKSIAYTAVLTLFNADEMMEFIQSSQVDITKQLREFLPSLSSQQQRSIVPEVLDLLGIKELPCDERESRRERERERDKERDRTRGDRERDHRKMRR